jgi:hypothetical protein
LLECEVPKDDPAIQKAARALRPETIRLTHTYSVALAILFLDRLDERHDDVLIQSLTVRLLDGQDAAGGWSYSCPVVSMEGVRRLISLLQKPGETVGSEPGKAARSQTPAKLSGEILDHLKRINPDARPALGDNSNTKFATLALWSARRHGMPVDNALSRVEARFRLSQHRDGGWGYLADPSGRTDKSFASMSCAGLLGLAVGLGRSAERETPAAAREKQDNPVPANDRVIHAGLEALGKVVGTPIDRPVPDRMALFNPKGDEYYFLWALERVAMAYGLSTIGKKDWYAWGAEWLLARQQTDGSWRGAYGETVDTCFALLFLRRADLSRDLSERLKGRVGDPSVVSLKTGPPQTAELFDAEVARLSKGLVQAAPDRQIELMEQYRDAKGVVHTQALAAAIPRLDGLVQARVREALSERLERMTAATLRTRLQDHDPEIRQAAVRACARKQQPNHIPDLIPLLEDPKPEVTDAAHAALKALANGKDFGPAPTATQAQRRAAVDAWKAWWLKRDRKP